MSQRDDETADPRLIKDYLPIKASSTEVSPEKRKNRRAYSHIQFWKSGQKQSVVYLPKCWSLTSAMHVTAARLRFGLNVNRLVRAAARDGGR